MVTFLTLEKIHTIGSSPISFNPYEPSVPWTQRQRNILWKFVLCILEDLRPSLILLGVLRALNVSE